MRDRSEQRHLGIVVQAAAVEIGGQILRVLFPVALLSDCRVVIEMH
jgi:hypothetical protein